MVATINSAVLIDCVRVKKEKNVETTLVSLPILFRSI